MKIAYKIIDIAPDFKINACGHLVQTFDIDKLNDSLNARVLYLEQDDTKIIHISFDTLAISLEIRNELQDYLRTIYGTNLHLITSATHTHYSGNMNSPKYIEYLMNKLKTGLLDLDIKEEGDLEIAHKVIFYNEVGDSRISNYNTSNNYLLSLKIKNKHRQLINIIAYNCHPTCLSAYSKFFSSEYPGNLMRLLAEKENNVFHTFIQGAAGDISTRFTRSGQEYGDMLKLTQKLFDQATKLNAENNEYEPLKLEYHEKLLVAEHEFDEVDLSKMPDNLSPRELETIEFGKIMRQKLKEHPEKLINKLLFASLKLSDNYKLVFEPNEMFSAYISYLDINKEYLCSYSNGYGPYITPIDFETITYECFTDTLTKNTKKQIIEILKTI